MRSAAWGAVVLGLISISMFGAHIAPGATVGWQLPDWAFQLMLLAGIAGAIVAVTLRVTGASRLVMVGMIVSLAIPILFLFGIMFLVLNKAH